LVPGLVGGGAVIEKGPPAAQARRLRRVTLFVPESCAEGLRDLARVLRAQYRERTPGPPLGWRRLSPSAELMVDPEIGARCTIRDTRAADAERYHWTVSIVGEPGPVNGQIPWIGVEAQFVFHDGRGFTSLGRAIFKNCGNLMRHVIDSVTGRDVRDLPIFDDPRLTLNHEPEPENARKSV
jgi:hypothetical protein